MTYETSTYHASQQKPVSEGSISKPKRLVFIGCTCGGKGPCRATCRIPIEE